MGTLILIRHGQSQWNLENRFAGWSDIRLTEQGTQDAGKTAASLNGKTFDIAFTSRLMRANQTMDIILKANNQSPEVIKDSALNERHYGDLQGLNKAETAEKFGQEQLKQWRRSYSTRPPNGESMEDCERRTLPFFLQYVMPHLKDGKTVLVVAHGNSLRPIMKFMEKLSPEDSSSREIGLCTPYVYEVDANGEATSSSVIEVPGIVTLGASTTTAKVESGRV